ncbi:tyrosine-protein phosphatase [Dehalococcoidia bacterium]|nr:tyrosine-protein phosphatase [Dehalococcoidia bacterium]
MYEHLFDEPRRVEWVIEGVLCRGQRPGYPVNRPSIDKIQEWTDSVLGMGIRSVICILDAAQIAYYDYLNMNNGGLFGYYDWMGLKVEYIEADDYKTPSLSDEQLWAAWEAFQRLEKPVLVHCSAGRDRTGAAVQYIEALLQEDAI